ncbi:MAG: type II toxin-antitoxin system VapC family toxin [Beijerinckiaceae bacterium]|nr:type II toxin-antitoxin system VapC family toxin [Beijerinckiaceae bacterium]
MAVIDTSVWIEFLLGTPIGKKMSSHFAERSRCIVPTIVQLELMKWLTREMSEDIADRVIAFTLTCDVTLLDTRVALRAADISRQHKLATADAIIYATALERDVELVTCDAHFKGLEGVIFHPKEKQ